LFFILLTLVSCVPITGPAFKDITNQTITIDRKGNLLDPGIEVYPKIIGIKDELEHYSSILGKINEKQELLIFIHGGLNPEEDSLKRIDETVPILKNKLNT